MISTKRTLLLLSLLSFVCTLSAQQCSPFFTYQEKLYTPEDSLSKHKTPYEVGAISFLYGAHQTQNTGIEIGISRNVGKGGTAFKGPCTNCWTYTYSVSTEIYFVRNWIVAPKISLWFRAAKLRFVCIGGNAFYAFDLNENTGAPGLRPEAGIQFRVPVGSHYRYSRVFLGLNFKLVYGYNFTSSPGGLGTHQVSLVFFKTGNDFRGRNYK